VRGAWPTHFTTGTAGREEVGKYKAETEDVLVEVGDGEKVTMNLIQGRQTLVWDSSVYGTTFRFFRSGILSSRRAFVVAVFASQAEKVVRRRSPPASRWQAVGRWRAPRVGSAPLVNCTVRFPQAGAHRPLVIAAAGRPRGGRKRGPGRADSGCRVPGVAGV
jgi:hypothetical protein